MHKHRPHQPLPPSPPPSSTLSLGMGHSTFTPLPDGPRSLPLPSTRDGPRSLPSSTSKRSNRPWNTLSGPFDGPSYSSFARLAGRDDSPNVVTSVSLPAAPNVEAEGVRSPISLRRRLHSALRAASSNPTPPSQPPPPHPTDPASLTRSDSLLNRARRYFSLPTSLKRKDSKTPLVPSAPRPEEDAPTSLRLGALAYRRPGRRQRGSSTSFTPSTPTNTIPPAVTASRGASGSVLAGRAPRRSSRNPAEAGALRPVDAAAARRDDNPIPGDDASRIRWLEDQLEAARVKSSRQRRRVAQLEEELARDRQARPALEALVESAMRHFEAKETALKHTIARLDHDYTTVLAEKNEAMRLLTAFVGRGGRSPPASFSSVSEAGTDSTHHKASRRTLSMDTFRRASPPNPGPRTIVVGGESEQGVERIVPE